MSELSIEMAGRAWGIGETSEFADCHIPWEQRQSLITLEIEVHSAEEARAIVEQILEAQHGTRPPEPRDGEGGA